MTENKKIKLKLPIGTNTPRPNFISVGMMRPINPLDETEGYEIFNGKEWEVME